jgi:hypothetical protein
MPNIRIALPNSLLPPHLEAASPTMCATAAAGNRVMTDKPSLPEATASKAERKPLTPAAQRALAEAEARRKEAEANAKPKPREFQGPKGPEPTRYGDWETKGIASDF